MKKLWDGLAYILDRMSNALDINKNMTAFLYTLLILMWIVGATVVKGFWLTVLAYMFPPYAWVLATEFFFNLMGLL